MGIIMSALSALGGAAGTAAGAIGSGISSGTAALEGLKGAASGALSNAFGADNVSAIGDMVGKAQDLGNALGGGGGGGPAAPAPAAPAPSGGMNIPSAPALSGDGALGTVVSPEELKKKLRGGIFS